MNFKQLTKRIFHKRAGSLHKKGLYNPNKDWMWILISFCVLVILAIVMHTTAYVLAEKGVIFNKEVNLERFEETLRVREIDNVIKKYEAKKQNLDSLNDIVLENPAFD